jgi:hypothetical protein
MEAVFSPGFYGGPFQILWRPFSNYPPGTIVVSDMWAAYNFLHAPNSGYAHETISYPHFHSLVLTRGGRGGFGEGAHPPQTVLQLSGEGAAITKGKFTLDRMRFSVPKKRSPNFFYTRYYWV